MQRGLEQESCRMENGKKSDDHLAYCVGYDSRTFSEINNSHWEKIPIFLPPFLRPTDKKPERMAKSC